MMSPLKSALAFTVVASLFGTPAFATEADINFPAGPDFLHPEQTDQISSKMTNQEQWWPRRLRALTRDLLRSVQTSLSLIQALRSSIEV